MHEPLGILHAMCNASSGPCEFCCPVQLHCYESTFAAKCSSQSTVAQCGRVSYCMSEGEDAMWYGMMFVWLGAIMFFLYVCVIGSAEQREGETHYVRYDLFRFTASESLGDAGACV